MNHLSENQLNEYMDHSLETEALEAVEQHLSTCSTCRDSLSALENLTAILHSLPDETPVIDLVSTVLADLPDTKMAPGWRVVLGIQLGVVLGLLLSIIFSISHSAGPIEWLGLVYYRLTHFKFPAALPFSFSIPHPSLQLPVIQLSIPHLQPTLLNMIVLGIAGLLLFGLENFILFHDRKADR
jgi:predicted anti-sigma-YlaC factor YlaD